MSGPLPSEGRRQLGRYELVARIGEGGMAEVHLARQRGPMQFEKLVVVKTVHPRLASRRELANLLLEEARIAALVKHPNVVDIYDLGEDGGTYFIAMEYLEGEALGHMLKASRSAPGGRLDPFSTARIIADGAAGLHAAHELRSMAGEPLELVHQDVTPGNVIVLYTGQVKLVDFGVARVRTTVDDGMVKGKTGYLAPELLEPDAPSRPDRRIDVWSLGVVLWESLTLRRLFYSVDERETVQRIRTAEIVAPSRLNAAVPRDLDEVCMAALERDPSRRYATAHSMQVDLEQILRQASWTSNEPIARFMRGAFADRLAARRELIKEVATSRGVKNTTLDRIVAIRDSNEASPGPTSAIVLGAHGAGEIPTAPPPRRRRAIAAAAIAVLGLGVVVTVALAAGGGDAAKAAAAPDAGLAIAAAEVMDAAVIEVAGEPDAAPVELPVVADAGVQEPPRSKRDDKKRDRRDDKDDRDKAPVSAKSLYKDGLQRFVSGDVEGALELFQKSLKLNSRYAPAWRGQGMAYERRGDRSKASKAYRKYLELAPDASDADSIRKRLEKL